MSLKVPESSNRERWKIHLGNGSEFSIIKGRQQFPVFEAQQISPKRTAEGLPAARLEKKDKEDLE